MYSVGLFYAWDFLGFIILTIAYIYAPKYILQEKNEYVAFFLKFLSGIFTLSVIIINITANKELTHMIFWAMFFPLLFIFHSLFSFKTVKRSQHLSFFLFFISGFILAVRGMILLAFLFSGM